MTRRFVLMTLAAGMMAVLAGCSVDTNLGGVKIPNARPDTRVAGQPPTLLEAGYAVEFHWTGADPDGKIAGYEWKISDNGFDGIDVHEAANFERTPDGMQLLQRLRDRLDGKIVGPLPE